VLSVNVSPVQLRERGRLAGLVAAALAASGLPARRLQLEVTEGALTGDIATARDALAELKATGMRLALDDFGTGHSGLRELQRLPFDVLKLDRSFIRAAAEEDIAARRIVAAVVGLGQSLGLPVVAEGVEAEHDAEMLRVLGCDAAQGWLFGYPKPATEAALLAAAAAAPAQGADCVA
jgi:EAL domain-containing protein (putative c-di-GMP-specific phosphodiesterase class I)